MGRETIEPTGRRAFTCAVKGCGEGKGPVRIFLPQGQTTAPRCPEHPSVPMVRQPNKPYARSEVHA